MRVALTLLFLLFPLLFVHSLEHEIPSWTIYERALDLLPLEDDAITPGGQNDPGEALRLFREAILTRHQELSARSIEIETEVSLFPEAEAGLARVYRIEGNIPLAERHYRRALDSAAFLAIPTMELEIRYELAELLEMDLRRREAQQQWLAIVREVDDFGSVESRALLDNYQRIFWEEGLDRLVQLYRQPESGSVAAHRALGRQFLGMGRYEAAFEHELFVTVKVMTQVVEAIKIYRPLFEFEEMDATLGIAAEHPDIEQYLVRLGLFDSLERLAQSAYRLRTASGRHRELWQLVATRADRGSVVQRKAARRFDTPQTDPLVVPR